VLLAAKTGWSEHFIRWDLPLSRAHAYLHTIALIDGADTQWPYQADRTAEWIHSIRDWATSSTSSLPLITDH
jgi:hypothetical protein